VEDSCTTLLAAPSTQQLEGNSLQKGHKAHKAAGSICLGFGVVLVPRPSRQTKQHLL